MSEPTPRRSSRSRPAPDKLQTPADYELWTAAEKHYWLWNTLILGTAHPRTELPDLKMPFKTEPLKEIGIIVRKRELEKALDRTEDLMEPGRPKTIHAHGSVAMITLETSPDSPFTGLLSPGPEGGATGLIRLSLVAKVVGKAAFTPALALKFLIDGKPSADLLAMNHTVGQGRDFDLFSNVMTNDLTESHSELRFPQRLMSFFFHRISENPRRLVVDHFANQYRDGAAVVDPVRLTRLEFHPTDSAKQIFVNQAGVDFRLVLDGVDPGTPLYDVLGITDAGVKPVGVIRTTTGFTSSDGGDRLYFRHVQDPSDRKPA